MSDRQIKQLREQRMSWVDLDPVADTEVPQSERKRVRIIRPTEVEIATHLVVDGQVEVGFDAMRRFTVDWAGFSEADILGSAVGASDALPFSAAVWAEIASDRVAWVRLVSNAILESAVAHHLKKEAALKN